MPAVYLDVVSDASPELDLDGCSWLRMTVAIFLVMLVVGSLGSMLYMLSSIAHRLPPPDEELGAGRIRLEDGPVDERGRPVLAIVTTPPTQDGQRVPLRTWNICGGGMAF